MEKLKKQSSLVDKIDRITGPLSFALIATGSQNLEKIGYMLSITELVLLKTPFVLKYTYQTRDFKSLLYWIPKEIVSNYQPINGLIDIFPVYRWRTNVYLKNKNL